jgi:hypothetical protein
MLVISGPPERLDKTKNFDAPAALVQRISIGRCLKQASSRKRCPILKTGIQNYIRRRHSGR